MSKDEIKNIIFVILGKCDNKVNNLTYKESEELNDLVFSIIDCIDYMNYNDITDLIECGVYTEINKLVSNKIDSNNSYKWLVLKTYCKPESCDLNYSYACLEVQILECIDLIIREEMKSNRQLSSDCVVDNINYKSLSGSVLYDILKNRFGADMDKSIEVLSAVKCKY